MPMSHLRIWRRLLLVVCIFNLPVVPHKAALGSWTGIQSYQIIQLKEGQSSLPRSMIK